MANNGNPAAKRILVVDDDLELCQVIVDTLRENGYDAFFAQTTEEALEKIESAPVPDLILLDLEVPKMGGLVLCHGLRNTPKTKNTPIIFLSVRDSDIDKRTASSLGANLYITKPFRRSHLLKEVHSMLFDRDSSSAEQETAPFFVPEKNVSTPSDVEPAPMVTEEISRGPSNLVDGAEPSAETGFQTAGHETGSGKSSAVVDEDVMIEDESVKSRVMEETPAKTVVKISEPVVETPPSSSTSPSSSKPAADAGAVKKSGLKPPETRRKDQLPSKSGPPVKPGRISQPVSAPEKKLSHLKESLVPWKAKIKNWVLSHKLVSIGIAFAVVAGLMWGSVFAYRKISDLTKKVKDQVKKETGAVAVNVIEVNPSSFRDVLSAVGTVAGGSEIELRFQVEGNIRSINFREGDAVQEGQVIAQLDQSQTLIKLERARSEFYRYEKLYALGGVSKDRLDEAKVQYDYAKTELNKTVLRSSKDGIFGDKGVEVGEFVTPQKKVGTLVSLDSVLIRVGVIEKEIDKVFPGQEVTATVDTYPDVEFKGKVENISPLVQGQSKTLTLEARMPNKGKLLLPGMFARTKIVIYEKENVISVPNDTLEKTEKGYKLFVVGKEEKAEERIVEVSYVSPTHSVVSNGLLPGEKIIIQKPQDLKAGSPLKIIEVEKGASGSAEMSAENAQSEKMGVSE